MVPLQLPDKRASHQCLQWLCLHCAYTIVLTLIGNSKGIAGVFWIKVQGQETSASFLTPTFAYSRFERTHTAAGKEKNTKPLGLTHQNIPKFTFKEGPVFPALKKSIPLHWCRHINMKCSSCRQSCFHSAKSSKDSWQPRFSWRL